MIYQLSVCLPNRPGRLAEMCRLLGEWGVQIRALMVAETVDFNIVRLICDRPRATTARLVEHGYAAVTSRLIAVELRNVPGELGEVLDRLASFDLNIDYAYSCPVPRGVADVIKVSGEPLEVKLAQTGLTLLEASDLYVADDEA